MNCDKGVRLYAFKESLRDIKDLSLVRIMDQKNLIPDVDLEGLTSLNLKDCKDLECLADTTEEHVSSSGMFSNLVDLVMENMVCLKMLCNGQPPKGFLPNLERLKVEECLEIVSLYPPTQNLKILSVKDCGKLQEVLRIDELLYNREENQAPPLSNLVCLELVSMPELRRVLKGPTQYVSLQSLKVVSIRKCNKLESLFSSSLTPSLRLLEKLCVSYCNKLETVFELGSDDETESNTLCVSNLKTLEIIECPTLKYVLPLASAQVLPRLQNLRLCFLTNLISFGPENNFIKAPALEILQVTGCPRLSNFTIQQHKPLQSKELVIGFEERIDDTESSNSQMRERSPNMMDFEQLIQLPGGYNSMSSLETMVLGGLIWLRYVWKVPIQVVGTNLRVLRVFDCNRLTYIFPIMLVRNLPKLSILDIGCCKNLEQIIVNEDISASSSSSSQTEKMLMFPQLKELCLGCLPSLVSFSPVGYHLVFPSLDYLEIVDCSQMIASFIAKTKAPRLDDTTPSKREICWGRDRHSTSLLP